MENLEVGMMILLLKGNFLLLFLLLILDPEELMLIKLKVCWVLLFYFFQQ